MIFHTLARRATPLLMLLAVISMGGFIEAQDANLLANPGFETFRTGNTQTVAADWQPWTAPRSDNASSGEIVPPDYFPASEANPLGVIPRIRSGDDAQVYGSYYTTHDAGVYQQVRGLGDGTEIRFSIYGYVLSTTFNDQTESEAPGGVAFRVGIDPTGGTDPLADSVEYSDAAIFYDAFRQYSLIAEAEGDTVTVFVRTTVTDPVQYTYIYLDDAVLEVTPDGEPPEEPTDAPTLTPTDEPTEEPTATPTEEPTDAPTITPTDTPDGEPDDPTPTREILTTPTPTEEGQVPTATPVAPTDEPDDDETETPPDDDEFPGQLTHIVSAGDTVYDLAILYGSTVNAIIEANGLNQSALIRRGQRLIIPVRVAVATDTPSPTPLVSATPTAVTGIVTPPPPPAESTYVVRPGDSLVTIARRFNTTVTTLVRLNGITNPNLIFVGQTLQIPTGDTSPAVTPTPTSNVILPTEVPPQPITYVVRPGDTLYGLALRFGVRLSLLADTNNIVNYSRIFVGQRLTIPQ